MQAKKLTGTHAIIQAIDPYLPPGIRNNAVLSLEGLIRARALTAMLICSLACTAFSFLVSFIFQWFTVFSFLNAIIISFVTFSITCFEYLYFYKSGKSDSAAILYSLSFFIVCIVSIVLTGGFESPVKQILLVCPVIAFLISGRQEGIYNSALVFVIGIILLVLDSIGFNLMQVMPPETLPYISGVTWLVTVLLVTVCLYIYDLLLEDKRSIKATQ